MKHLSAISILIAVGLLLTSCSPAVSENSDRSRSRIILGSTTELTGDFRFPGFGGASAGAADQDIAALTTGYAVMETDPSGEYVWNDTAVKAHTEEVLEQPDSSQNYRITVELNDSLTFSDGTPVTADHYLAYTLAFSTVVARSAGASGLAGQAFEGYAEFFNYTGNGRKSDENAPAAREFRGIRKLSDYKFSLEVDGSAGYYPYYYAYTYAALTPYSLELVLGEGVTIHDDGNGCYLDESWYEQDDITSPSYVRTAHLQKARYDTAVYPYTGPYTITEWDTGSRQAVLTKNDTFLGNFEGQKPSVQTVVYTRIVAETQFDQLRSGAVDILSGITGGEETKTALQAVADGFSENHYLRAGYGKIQFDCDFGPTLFPEVRQAIALLLDRASFATTFTGGYGKGIDAPYSEDSWMYRAVGETLEDSLERYDYSLTGAKYLLEQGGWIYNSRGEPYTPGGTGADRVRYKKITRADLESLTTPEGIEATLSYRSVNNTDNIVYRTVPSAEEEEIWYLPLAINWFSTENNAVSDLLATMLVGGTALRDAGMVIRQSAGDFNALLGELHRDPSYGYSRIVTYGMYNLATGFTSPVYDYAFQWSHDPAYFGFSAAKLYDPYDRVFPYTVHGGTLTYEEAMEQSDGQLGMDYLSMGMVYRAQTDEEYLAWWTAYLRRWNELLPEIPLYCNIYYDVYRPEILNYHTSPYWGTAEAILYCSLVG